MAVGADRAIVPIAIGGNRGQSGVVLRHVAVANQRRDRPADGRRRDASGTAPTRMRPQSATRSTSGGSRRTEPGRRLRLAAEMKVPGRAWLEFEVVPVADGAVVHQTAVFEPAGLSGLLYWYGLFLVHTVMFRGLLRAIAGRAVEATLICIGLRPGGSL